MPAEFKDRDLEAIVIFQAKSDTEFSRVPNLQIEDWEL
ncbi:MAG: hypothetical protein RLZZ115_3017 [Cyanobacteriota bacterium]